MGNIKFTFYKKMKKSNLEIIIKLLFLWENKVLGK
jgi:hypothetical protein